eukprot:TRINITY_DN1110_c0_g1_i1.p1 TRINITY_DN1110_c0_g1~~TRINITY_DN1110_c0_g1_i1.p1  ORF type:complete len:202 (-),score=40.47 TRINITY_DN1110_c0_g1_i1:92-697(-)
MSSRVLAGLEQKLNRVLNLGKKTSLEGRKASFSQIWSNIPDPEFKESLSSTIAETSKFEESLNRFPKLEFKWETVYTQFSPEEKKLIEDYKNKKESEVEDDVIKTAEHLEDLLLKPLERKLSFLTKEIDSLDAANITLKTRFDKEIKEMQTMKEMFLLEEDEVDHILSLDSSWTAEVEERVVNTPWREAEYYVYTAEDDAD